MSEDEALLCLNAINNLGPSRIRKLISYFGSAGNVLKAPLDDLMECNLLFPTTVENIFNFSKDKFIEGEYNLMRHKGISFMTVSNAAWPCSLDQYEDSPVVLYIKGDPHCLKQMSVALVGSRAASFYGRKSAKAFAQAFVQEGLLVVSGLARGIDTAAHQGCLEAGGKTIAVIGCGFNYMYPKENHSLMESISKEGAVVSEFPCAVAPLKQNFPWRNRVISALSLATVVIEAGRQSGALITADYAIAQNKDVFVLPSNVDNETALGSNQLIQDGARVALNPEDVLCQIKVDYKIKGVKKSKPMLLLSDEQERVFPYISYSPIHLEDLALQSGINIPNLMNIALSLELKHLIRQLPGQYYVRNEHA